MYEGSMEKASSITMTDLLIRADAGLETIFAILNGQDGNLKERGLTPRQVMPADEMVDQICKQLGDLVARIEELQPRLRKVVRSL